ncbi:MAG: gamma-glutamyl-gamma-aminobutyrate hydrolase family protein [Caldilineaceae bacterium]|nr:gamma-glutamyl-gamma-aminobutyrate hydrolase family protein [Caldilineaceae bacterium]
MQVLKISSFRKTVICHATPDHRRARLRQPIQPVDLPAAREAGPRRTHFLGPGGRVAAQAEAPGHHPSAAQQRHASGALTCRRGHRRGVPVLGICYGLQLLAHGLAAKSFQHRARIRPRRGHRGRSGRGRSALRRAAVGSARG